MIDRVRPNGRRANSRARSRREGVHPSKEPASEPSGQRRASIVVIIPALNEETSLPSVLADLPPMVTVLVVDNGSTDRTAEVACQAGATVLHEPVRGYGSACLRGLKHVEQLVRSGHPAPRVIAFLDADYSDHPELLLCLVEPILSGKAELVLGSRASNQREAGAMPPQAVFGNWLACLLMRLLFRTTYTDLGPFRAIEYSALQTLGMRDRGFGWTVEMQIKAARHGLRIVELAVPYRRRIGQSKISGTLLGTIRAGYTILYLIGKHALLSRPCQFDALTGGR
ncbi:MAG: glycosyltransferase family 2 protein [Planctomycetia bacterium]|nr:glycosyltransferase family 2 protein [Planctomycetia bacterium]